MTTTPHNQDSATRVPLASPDSHEPTRRQRFMAPSLAIGYALLATMAASALAVFGVIDWIVPAAYVDIAGEVSAMVLISSYVVMWLWMLLDHVVNGESDHTVLIAMALVLGGGLAALAYFFLVFRPRHATPSHD